MRGKLFHLFLMVFAMGLILLVRTVQAAGEEKWNDSAIFVSRSDPGKEEPNKPKDPNKPKWKKVKDVNNRPDDFYEDGYYNFTLGKDKYIYFAVLNGYADQRKHLVFKWKGKENYKDADYLKMEKVSGYYYWSNVKESRIKVVKNENKQSPDDIIERGVKVGERWYWQFIPQPDWEVIKIKNQADKNQCRLKLGVQSYCGDPKKDKEPEDPEYKRFKEESGFFTYACPPGNSTLITSIAVFADNATVDEDPCFAPVFTADANTGNWTYEIVHIDPNGIAQPQGGVQWTSDGNGLAGNQLFDFEFSMVGGADSLYTMYALDADANYYEYRIECLDPEFADYPSPYDGEEDVTRTPELSWQSGDQAERHLVYFGDDYDTVYTAIVPDSNQPAADTNWAPPGPLDLGKTYYWRIDEVNDPNVWKGDIWSFTTINYLVVDDFDSYANQNELWAVWDDYFVNGSGALIYLEVDPNYVRDGNSVKFTYYNADSKIGSYMDAQDPAELEVGADWTVGGVKALTLYFFGDPCNVLDAKYINGDRLWVELKEVGTDVKFVKHTDVNDMREPIWHEWNIALSDFSDAGVDLANLDRVTIGIGGYKAGQTGKATTQDQIWIDDIRLYPPRCLPELAQVAGNITDDCIIDACDLRIMTRDWVLSDCMAEPSPPAISPIVQYKFDEGSGTIAANTGSYDSSYDLVIGRYLDTNGVFGVHPNHAPVWLDDPNRGWCLRFDGEGGMWPGVPAAKTELMLGGDYLVSAPLDLTTDTMSITAWIKPNPTFGDGAEFKDGFTGIVVNRYHPTINNCDGTEAAGLHYCDGSFSPYVGPLGYTWNNDDPDTWNWDSDIYPTFLEWNLVAVTIAPDIATVYMIDESSTVIESATNAIEHSSETLNAKLIIAGDIGHLRFFKGDMDDIRIYDYTLTVGEVMSIAGMEGEVYFPNRSVANIVPVTPPPTTYDPNNPDIVNFLDYDLMADNWLAEFLWPPE